jgi:isocitrate dehydrogenase
MTEPTKITIPIIPGDGIGPEITSAMQRVVENALAKAYQGSKQIKWKECLAGKRAFEQIGQWLPDETLQILKGHKVSIKGPLTTPVGGGIRSLNVALRQELDLYVCLRPVRWYEGLPSPHRDPAGMDIIIFRENTEDLYAGIEYQAGSRSHASWMNSFKKALPEDFKKIPHPDECGIGIKPISKTNSQRLVRAALRWAIENHRQKVTLVHKGNIMKFTEGAFRNWGYEVAEQEFGDTVFSEKQYQQISHDSGTAAADQEKAKALRQEKIWLDDSIADITFEKLITRPQNLDVIATTNLNGDYLSDAAAALAGGVGISPGANINFESGTANFEANHGSAESLAGQNKANPSSLILSSELMLRFIGWVEAADLIQQAIAETIRSKRVTFDLAAQIRGAQTLGTDEFANAIINQM